MSKLWNGLPLLDGFAASLANLVAGVAVFGAGCVFGARQLHIMLMSSVHDKGAEMRNLQHCNALTRRQRFNGELLRSVQRVVLLGSVIRNMNNFLGILHFGRNRELYGNRVTVEHVIADFHRYSACGR